ncbi:MAG: serine hydrolase domain-containing protein [Rhodothermales bacterium]
MLVLLAHGDEVLYESACGEASKRFGAPNDLETRFNIGSMNKMFTAVAVMQLVEDGRLGLDNPIAAYVDESWLPHRITERVTVHHLLTHTSGLGSYFNETFTNSSRSNYRELSDYRPLVQGDTLAFEPGDRFRYSNTGMLLLGVVMESVTGTSYFDYVRDYVYEPAGMELSDSYSMDEPVPNLAIGYIPAPDTESGWRNNIFEHVMKGGPAGGGFSTAGDLHRFGRSLVAGELVSSTALDRMWTSHSDAGYGYGFGVSNGPAGKVVGHSGGFPGLNGNLDIFVDAGYVVAVLSNHDRAASPLAQYVKGLIERVPAP